MLISLLRSSRKAKQTFSFLLFPFEIRDTKMTDSPLSSSSSVGPLERSITATQSIVLQLGLLAEMQKTIADGAMTPELEIQFATVFAATSEPAEA